MTSPDPTSPKHALPDPTASEPAADATVDDIKADIEATRNELGQTVEALAAKVDVKAQARHKVDDTKELIADKANTLKAKGSEVGSHGFLPAAFAVAAIIVGVVIWRRRR